MSYIFGDYDMLLRIPVKTQFSCMSCSKCTTEEKTITPKEFGVLKSPVPIKCLHTFQYICPHSDREEPVQDCMLGNDIMHRQRCSSCKYGKLMGTLERYPIDTEHSSSVASKCTRLQPFYRCVKWGHTSKKDEYNLPYYRCDDFEEKEES